MSPRKRRPADSFELAPNPKRKLDYAGVVEDDDLDFSCESEDDERVLAVAGSAPAEPNVADISNEVEDGGIVLADASGGPPEPNPVGSETDKECPVPYASEDTSRSLSEWEEQVALWGAPEASSQ